MKQIITVDHDLARRVALGMVCVECDSDFVRAHGTPTACTSCWGKLPLEERKVVGRAIHEEATKEFFRNKANNRKRKEA